MASTQEHSSKIAPESLVARDSHRSASFSPVSLSLRMLLFASSLAAIIVIVTSKQTELIPVPVFPFAIRSSAKFNQSPAFIYLVVALAVAGFYGLVSILVSLPSKKLHSTKRLFHIILTDLLMLAIVASATGTAGSVAYIGLKGNSHAGWGEICGVFDKFCRHVGSAVALSLIASIALLLLVMLSTYNLYRRSS